MTKGAEQQTGGGARATGGDPTIPESVQVPEQKASFDCSNIDIIVPSVRLQVVLPVGNHTVFNILEWK